MDNRQKTHELTMLYLSKLDKLEPTQLAETYQKTYDEIYDCLKTQKPVLNTNPNLKGGI